jgi:hypothetical protein
MSYGRTSHQVMHRFNCCNLLCDIVGTFSIYLELRRVELRDGRPQTRTPTVRGLGDIALI